MARVQSETNTTAESSAGGAGPGALLLRARTARNLTPEQVAAELFLDVQLINALERDQFTKLPPPMYVRGYLRAYARFVDLDEAAIVEAYERITGSRGVQPEFKGQVYGKPEIIVSSGGGSWIGWLSILMLAGGGFWAWLARDAWLPEAWLSQSTEVVSPVAETEVTVALEPETATPAMPSPAVIEAVTPLQETMAASTPAPATSAAVEPAKLDVTAAPVATPSLATGAPSESVSSANASSSTGIDVITPPADEPEEEEPAVFNQPAAVDASPSAPQTTENATLAPIVNSDAAPAANDASVAPALNEATPVSVASSVEAVATDASATVDASADVPSTLPEGVTGQEIALRLTRESWVQISDGDGKKLAYGLLTPGQAHAFVGKPPFSVVLGYAVGAEVAVNGQPYDVARHMQGNVARFEVGQQ